MLPTTRTKPQIVIDHLKTIGRITDATARAAYGAFQLNHAIWSLKTKKSHLIPPGKKIVTIMRKDVAGNTFAEYRLVDDVVADKVSDFKMAA